MACFTDRVGALTTDFFVNLLDMGTKSGQPVDGSEDEEYVGTDRATGERKVARHPHRPGVRFQLAMLRAQAEVYAEDGSEGQVRVRLHHGLEQGDERRPVRRELRQVSLILAANETKGPR